MHTQPVSRSNPPRHPAADDAGFRSDDIGDIANEQAFGALCEAYRKSGGVACGDDLDRRLRAQPAGEGRSLARLIASRQVLAFEWRAARWIPMAQFDLRSLALKPQFLQAWSELAGDLDGWGVATWFARCNVWLAGKRPVDLIDSDLRSVLQAARTDRFVAVG